MSCLLLLKYLSTEPCTCAMYQDPPQELVDLLRWTLETIDVYFSGITGRMWIPRPEAIDLAQACHNMVVLGIDFRFRSLCMNAIITAAL